jgi:hypothetical protein
MRYVFYGEFSKGLDSITTMGVTFVGREPSEVSDAAAANWFDGHPDYVRVAEELAPEGPRRRIIPRPLPHPLDHDSDGKKGGSLPKKAKKKATKK